MYSHHVRLLCNCIWLSLNSQVLWCVVFQVAAAVSERLAQKQGETMLFPALQNLGRGIKSALPHLRQTIRHCIEVTRGVS